eukprot:TRINITY_DN663_c0_g1_i4.p1 TRINITY_DN663_c0_g1~~TRINITY_DN663_c0_g1_i4.p1  ORF type:complete len:204 (+),score=52.54 TRINITY_DN663_c0_g1_i4:192-803(+)
MTQCGCKRQPHLGNKGRWISKKDFKLLKMIFVAYDTDDSGSVTYQEFQKRFSDNPELNVTMLPSMANIFEQLDGDHNGEMTFRELLAAYYPACSLEELDDFINKYDPRGRWSEQQSEKYAHGRKLTLEQEEELEALMMTFDLNSDGVCSRSEMALYCSNLGIGDDTVADWFEEFDADQNGTLDMQEFKEFFRKQWTGDPWLSS